MASECFRGLSMVYAIFITFYEVKVGFSSGQFATDGIESALMPTGFWCTFL